MGHLEEEEPFITSVNRSNPIGKLVDDYANRMWWNGFHVGVRVGAVSFMVGFILLDSLVLFRFR